MEICSLGVHIKFFPKHSSLSHLRNSEEEVISMLQVCGAD